MEVHTQEEEVVIALGSNVGDRLHNFNEVLQLMNESGVRITRHACLYETEPAYVTDQPIFLNSAVRAVTKLRPHELLAQDRLTWIYCSTGNSRYILRFLQSHMKEFGRAHL